MRQRIYYDQQTLDKLWEDYGVDYAHHARPFKPCPRVDEIVRLGPRRYTVVGVRETLTHTRVDLRQVED